jgi:dipeptidyl aminopeptidase/acylaminoacyl peptidase
MWRLAAALAGIVSLGLPGTQSGAKADALAGAQGAQPEQAAPGGERLVHRYLGVVISPDAQSVADVEGDAPAGGYYPPLRDLVIRRVRDAVAVTVAVPCGHVPQCWPDSPTWSPDGKHLSFTLRSPGSHARSLYRVAADGSGLVKILDFNGTIEQLRYMPDGTLAMLATLNATKEVGATEAGAGVSGDLDAAPPEQRIATVAGGGLHWLSPPDLFVYEYAWRGTGKGFVGTAAPGDGDDNYWSAKLYSFAAGDGTARVIYTPSSIRQQLAAPSVSRDGGTVAFIAGIMSDFGSTGGDVYALSLDGGAPQNLTPDLHASATSLAWRCDGHLQAQLLAGDETQIVDLGLGQRATPPKVLMSATLTLGRRFAGLSMACPSGIAADEVQSFTAPPEIGIGPIDHWQNLTSLNAGLTVPYTAQNLTWQSDQFSVQGWLLLPLHAAGSIPMLTSVHGGPAAAVTPNFVGPSVTRTLLEHGYALFLPNPRGSFGQGERFTAANVRDLGYGDLRDILAGIDAAAKVAPIDTGRLGITGGSYGGFMTMWAVTQTDRFKAGVAAAGISDWLSYYGENGIDGWMLPYFGASAYDDPAIYARSSAINYIHNVKTPTFAYVGELDIECPPAQTQEFWHAMKAMNLPTSIMIYPGEGHGLRDPKNLADARQRTLAWFDKYLR